MISSSTQLPCRLVIKQVISSSAGKWRSTTCSKKLLSIFCNYFWASVYLFYLERFFISSIKWPTSKLLMAIAYCCQTDRRACVYRLIPQNIHHTSTRVQRCVEAGSRLHNVCRCVDATVPGSKVVFANTGVCRPYRLIK